MDAESITTGVLSGLLTSILWLIALRLVKPKIRISKQIRQAPKDGTYQIKVLNARLTDAINVKAQLYMLVPTTAGDDRFSNSTLLELKRSELMAISGWKLLDEGAPVFRFVLKDISDLKALLRQHSGATLAFRLLATHPISQSTRLFKMDYTEDNITHGDYRNVRSLTVDEQSRKNVASRQVPNTGS
jgi:hypothetical protein